MFYELKHLGTAEYFLKESGENFNFPAHLHSSFELVVILNGSMQITVGTNVYTVNKNEGVLIFPNQIHSLDGKECQHILFIFSPELVKAYSNKVTAKLPENNVFKLDSHLITELNSLNETHSTIKKKGVLYSVCAQFDSEAIYTDRKNDKRNLLYKIFQFVELEYSKECTLKELSEKLAYDYSYLSRYIKNSIGISFNDYVNRYRISKACELLANSNHTVLECAIECGYTSLRSFNRNFKQILAVTPTAYKKALQSN